MSAKGEVVGEREIVITRTFDAPREAIWAAWTDAKHLDQWWGPNGFRNETHAMDFRVGGIWRYTMHGPDGTDYPNWIRYREIVRFSRLFYDHGGGDDKVHFEASATFEDLGDGRTRVTMRSVFPTKEARDHVVHVYGAVAGGMQTLDRSAAYVDEHRKALS
jgi:uncharacterized protein YndB with AHSA1/START domain